MDPGNSHVQEKIVQEKAWDTSFPRGSQKQQTLPIF